MTLYEHLPDAMRETVDEIVEVLTVAGQIRDAVRSIVRQDGGAGADGC